jgi:ribosomal protein S18 acetylase RimI-like enzyme
MASHLSTAATDTVVVRHATEGDLASVHRLIVELAEFELAREQVVTTEATLRDAAFGPQPICFIVVAESADKSIVGAALWYYRYSTWRGRTLYLEDLIVKKSCRGSGIGSHLLDCLVRLSVACDCPGGIVWQVLQWNEPAIAFYKKWGATIDPQWYNCNMFLPSIKAYLAAHPQRSYVYGEPPACAIPPAE